VLLGAAEGRDPKPVRWHHHARRGRSALSALGIAVAIAALVSVLGIAASAKANLLAQLGAEGNLLTLVSRVGSGFTVWVRDNEACRLLQAWFCVMVTSRG
jgi:hypothetical protein